MTVYVDNMKNSYRHMKMCHMVADSLEELHAMADKIGLKRDWFQFDDPRHPHYDLSQTKRKLAIESGAVETTPQELVNVLHRWYQGTIEVAGMNVGESAVSRAYRAVMAAKEIEETNQSVFKRENLL